MKWNFFLLGISLLFCCGSHVSSEEKEFLQVHYEEGIEDQSLFSRDSILKNLQRKVQKKEALLVHILVPLCDNENQGIVPVNASLGNGLNLTTNLYWGAAYGMKTYFRKRTDWKFLKSVKPESPTILERVIFSKSFSNGAKVYLIADAYRGDKMKECLEDYFSMLSGNKVETVNEDSLTLSAGSNADLIIFNGHNGLMDVNVDSPSWSKGRRDAAAIGCYSHSYFKSHFLNTGAYPLLATTHLMAPEAYVAEALINSWANLSSGDIIRTEAAEAYNTWQKCGMKGAMNLFKTGW